MDKLMATIKKVVEDWDLFELVLTVLFFPYSLIYIAFRIVQEW